MCTTGDRDLQAPNQRQQLLPAHANGHPRVTLVQPDSEQPEIIVASWHTTDGNRLAATIDGRRLDLDSEPALFKGALYREISLSGNQVWIAKGLRLTDDEMENAIIASADGSRFPITVSSYAPEYTLNPLNFLSRLMVPVVALLFFVIIGFTLKRLNKSITSNAESSIESALDDGQIQPMFQPLIELTTGRVIGAEILMRWQKKDGTIARPGDFIHRVETAGLTRELTVSLLNSAIMELGETYRELPSMTLSINLFPSDIKSDQIVSMVQETLTDRPLRAEQIIFEVTERRGLEDLEAVQGVLAGLSKLGARVALDNAGAGHLGLSGLRQLWPDVVKIDKVLVDALDQEDNARSIIDTIVGLAGELAIGIVAEGVETIDQMTRLKAIGVTAAQGYLFSKPLPGDEFQEFLKKSLRGELSKKLEEMQAASSQKGKAAPVKAA
jgi:sensor c-di-GMP phosphodiesterase-like protein